MFVEPRYGLPLVPFLTAFASVTIVAIVQGRSARSAASHPGIGTDRHALEQRVGPAGSSVYGDHASRQHALVATTPGRETLVVLSVFGLAHHRPGRHAR